jgi:hypothetical protein
VVAQLPYEKTSGIDSIDELALNKDARILETGNVEKMVDSNTQLFVHVSNLQAWVEHDYDTRILHSNLSFPLLKELSKYDDKAKVIYESEIIERVSQDFEPTSMTIIETMGSDVPIPVMEMLATSRHPKVRKMFADSIEIPKVPDNIIDIILNDPDESVCVNLYFNIKYVNTIIRESIRESIVNKLLERLRKNTLIINWENILNNLHDYLKERYIVTDYNPNSSSIRLRWGREDYEIGLDFQLDVISSKIIFFIFHEYTYEMYWYPEEKDLEKNLYNFLKEQYENNNYDKNYIIMELELTHYDDPPSRITIKVGKYTPLENFNGNMSILDDQLSKISNRVFVDNALLIESFLEEYIKKKSNKEDLYGFENGEIVTSTYR